MEQYAVEFRNITKRFGSVLANDKVNLSLKNGEILAVLGENGSGKTTLMNMLSGIYKPDEGEIFINGELATIQSPQDAFRYHVGMIHQHFKLVDRFTAAENVVLGLSKEDYKIHQEEQHEKYLDKEQEYGSYKEVSEKLKETKKLLKETIDKKEIEKLTKELAKLEKAHKVLKDYKRYDRRAHGFDMNGIKERITNISKKYGFDINPEANVHDLSVSEKQTLEIVKVLYRGADILVLDEPTAVLTPQEIKKLFAVLRNMKENGKSIIIITHKLNEVMEISDRVAILRKGKYISTVETSKTNEKQLAELMVGEKINLDIKRSKPVNPVDRLFVCNVSVNGANGEQVLKDVSFVARSGEILGIAGIAGSGQKELLEAITGLHHLTSGEIVFHNPKENQPATFYHKDLKTIKKLINENAFHYPDGKPVTMEGLNSSKIKHLVNEGQILFNQDEIVDLKGRTPLEIRELGIRLSFVPEDRLGMGLVGNMSLTDNTMLRSYRHGHAFFLDREKPRQLTEKIIKELNVSTPSTDIAVSKLSGGNVQKILVGREIALAPKVLMTAYPVRGLDINSSYTIYNLLDEQKRKGIAVIYVGEDLDVLLALCDRILVLCGGRVSGIVDARSTTKDEIGVLMTKVEK